MNKDFDEHMRKEGDGFRLQPREEVWTRIEAELDAKKERRRILWYWWVLPILLAGVWGSYALLQQNIPSTTPKIEKELPKQYTTHPTPDAESNIQMHQTDNASPAAGTDKAALPNSRAAVRTPLRTNTSNRLPEKSKFTSSTQAPRPGKALSERADNEPNEIENYVPAKDKSEKPFITNQQKHANQVQNELAEKKAEDFISSEESFTNTSESEQSIEIVNTEREQTTPKPDKPNLKKDVRWRILAGIGRHTYTPKAGPGLSTNDMQSSEPLFNPTNPGSNSASNTPPQPGTGFMVGIERAQSLKAHPRWEWQAGIHYQYQTVQVSTGQRRDSTLLLVNMGAGFSNNRSAYYYLPGSANKQVGRQHRIHLQTGMGWHLHQNRKWTLQGLVYGGVVLSADYLVPHTPQTGYVPVKNVLNKAYYGLETGIRFQPKAWGIGLYGQTNLSSSVKSNLLSNQYWRGAELRINYQLSPKK